MLKMKYYILANLKEIKNYHYIRKDNSDYYIIALIDDDIISSFLWIIFHP